MTWNQVAVLKRMSVGLFLKHTPPEATSSQKSVLFHDLCPRVCDPHLYMSSVCCRNVWNRTTYTANISPICKPFSIFKWHVLWQMYSTSHKMCMKTITRLVFSPTNSAKFIQCVYVCTGYIKNTWQFFKWNNFFKSKWKNFINTTEWIPCPWEFILVITILKWQFVCDHHVVRHTPAVTLERMS